MPIGRLSSLGQIEDRLKNQNEAWTKVMAEMRKAADEFMRGQPIPARWRRAYIRCLDIRPRPGGGVILELNFDKVSKEDAFFANVIENGVPTSGIDMKPWYHRPVNIPIMKTQKQIRGLADKGSQARVLAAIQALNPDTRQRAPAGLVGKIRPEHAVDPLAQAIRQSATFHSQKTGKRRGRRGSVVAFRRLTPMAPRDPEARRRWKDSWIWGRGGIPGRHLIWQLREIFVDVINRVLPKFIFGD